MAIFALIGGILQIIMDAKVEGIGEIWGIPYDSRGVLNPLIPFQIIFMVPFLFLYWKKSKYAWHTLMVFFILDIPYYWLFRAQEIYFRPPKYTFGEYSLVISWVVLPIYLLYIRSRYLNYISSGKNTKYLEK